MHSQKFLVYVLDSIFPTLHTWPEHDRVEAGESETRFENTRLEILRLTTDMSHYLNPAEMKDLPSKIDIVLDQLLVSIINII